MSAEQKGRGWEWGLELRDFDLSLPTKHGDRLDPDSFILERSLLSTCGFIDVGFVFASHLVVCLLAEVLGVNKTNGCNHRKCNVRSVIITCTGKVRQQGTDVAFFHLSEDERHQGERRAGPSGSISVHILFSSVGM